MFQFLLCLSTFWLPSVCNCPDVETISNHLLTTYVGAGECLYDEVKKDVDDGLKSLDYCGDFKESDHIEFVPNGVPCSSMCIACMSTAHKVTIRKEWACKKPIPKTLIEMTCSSL